MEIEYPAHNLRPGHMNMRTMAVLRVVREITYLENWHAFRARESTPDVELHGLAIVDGRAVIWNVAYHAAGVKLWLPINTHLFFIFTPAGGGFGVLTFVIESLTLSAHLPKGIVPSSTLNKPIIILKQQVSPRIPHVDRVVPTLYLGVHHSPSPPRYGIMEEVTTESFTIPSYAKSV